jgi:hypothetical protein
MQDRRIPDYRLLFRNLRRWIEAEHNGTIGELGRGGMYMADFEAAASAAMRLEFPELTLKYCTFHWSQVDNLIQMCLGGVQAYR